MSARKPKLTVPVGSTDTHMHFYHAEVPAAPGGPPLPGDYRVEQYRQVQQRLGLSRVIVVQPNAYQDDNRVTLAAINALGPGAKGVGVVKPDVSDADIAWLTEGGIIAQRIFQLPWGAVGFDRMHDVMATRASGRLARQHPARWSRAAAMGRHDQKASGQVRDRSRRKVSRTRYAGSRSIQVADATARHRTLLGQAFGAV